MDKQIPQKYEVGDTLIHTGNGKVQEGHSMTVTDVMREQTGFVRYADENGQWHRQDDLIKART